MRRTLAIAARIALAGVRPGAGTGVFAGVGEALHDGTRPGDVRGVQANRSVEEGSMNVDDFTARCQEAWEEFLADRDLNPADPERAQFGLDDMEMAFKDGFSAAWAQREFRQ